MSATTFRTFFGDAERAFRITPPLLLELEVKTGTGIGGLIRRVVANDFRIMDVIETIRLGLIGGGEKPSRADALVRTYVHKQPLSETYPIAVGILEALWFGAAKPEPAAKESAKPEATSAPA